jgi:SRSO17 transposase
VRIGHRFPQQRSWLRAQAYLRGLLSRTERKNGWHLAEYAGESTPDGMQRLLNAYRWDTDGVRDDLREYVIDHLGHAGGVLVADETGFVKKGAMSVGVQRQYSGTAGRIENCQVGVFLTYASARGRALIDRELYLPERSWCADRERCRQAAVPDQVAFATKPQFAQRMIGRAVEAGVPFAWVAADEVYGQNPALRSWLEGKAISYVMAVPCSQEFNTEDGPRRAKALAALLPCPAWHMLSCGQGAKGPRLYDWALIDTTSPAHRLLIRRSLTDPSQLAYFICHSQADVPLHELVAVVGVRWTVEECFQAAKNEVGLDHYQVRLWHAWYRHVTLAMLAHAWLAVTAAAAKLDASPDSPPSADHADPAADSLAPLSVNEIRRLHANLACPARSASHVLAWSQWRRRHQARARNCHYRRRLHRFLELAAARPGP